MPAAIPIMIGLTAGGIALNAYGQKKAGDAAKDIGDYNAQVYDQLSADALDRGRVDEQKFRQGVKGLIGSQKAGFAGQGVDVNSGSALDVQADAAYLGELDALTIHTNAQREAAGYRAQATSARMGGQQAQMAGNFNAAATVLGGAGQLGGQLAARYGWGRAA